MASGNKRIAVIGGGAAGIASLVELKEEGGFDLICFEKTDNYCGTWCYREESAVGIASIMPTTHMVSSKEISAISNFPPRKEYSNFMRHDLVYEYLQEYGKLHDVLKYIQFNSEVTEVKRLDDFEETGRWKVTVKNTSTGEITTGVYEGIMVCIGHINRPSMPSYPGQELFKGNLLHSHSVKGVETYKNKTIVVVGMGCSGLDSAIEMSNVAKQVYLSARNGVHVVNRVGLNGIPYDYALFRPYLYQLMDIFPIKFVSWCVETGYLDTQFNHKLYAVVPKQHLLTRDPSVTSNFSAKLINGAVIQKPGIQRFTEDGVIFEGETEVTKADVVIMATGYTWNFPFLEEGVLVREEDRLDLYKCVFPIQLKHPTLAFIGFISPFGPGFPPGELQCRWVAQVFAGKCKLPSQKEMLKHTKKRYKTNVARYGPSEKVSIKVDFIQYCDEIAVEFGAKPDLLNYFFTDIKLFSKIMFGPSLAYQYRLQGPHPWNGAREAIMTSEERMLFPLARRESNVHENIFKRLFRKSLSATVF
ncbi:Dimethylaniline monooxygenase [N-oxide-forming] 2 [Araneus ventricosus]|uniref:Flavin-containing monooxygenase n=1 Tax=Araneus ventricosus TaxID=182803 RepID=A0A4Y2MY32_ARAVE|nr:Dimethylaniline monooxygenase [N-oxide-forming] 2 [Araneus ventricosus]